jgi:hypothetical protein
MNARIILTSWPCCVYAIFADWPPHHSSKICRICAMTIFSFLFPNPLATSVKFQVSTNPTAHFISSAYLALPYRDASAKNCIHLFWHQPHNGRQQCQFPVLHFALLFYPGCGCQVSYQTRVISLKSRC